MASHSKAPPRSRGKRGGNGAEISARRQQLYALPLADFTRARDALAKELASEGHSKEAREIRKLKRPVLGAWVVNQLVHLHPEDVEELLAAARALEKAQRRAMSGLAPEPLKEASRAFQRALDTLMNHVNALLAASGRAATGELIRQVDETLRASSLGSEEERSTLAQGMLTRPLRSSGNFGDFSPLQLMGPAPAPSQRAASMGGKVLHGPWATRETAPEPPPRPPPSTKKPARPPASRPSQRELQAEAKAQARRDREVELRKLQREARQQAQLAEKAERSARQNVVRTKAVLRTAEGRTRYARSAFEAAETRAERAREALEAAEEKVRQTREALEAAEAAEQEQAEEVSRASQEAEAAEQALTQAQRHRKQVESRRPH